MSDTPRIDESSGTATEAWADYRALAAQVGVAVRPVTGADPWAASALLEEIWGARPVEAALLVALEHAGGYAVVAVDDPDTGEGSTSDAGDQILGATVGFFAQPVGVVLHSHVAGVRPGLGRPGIGRAMKLHQRAWCLERGVTEVTWTFDPLVARNAHINISRLGAEVDEYLIDFYGAMTDGINAGQGSDRAVVRWHLDRPYLPGGYSAPTRDSQPMLSVAPDGTPQESSAPASAAVTVAIPRDVEGLRATNPALASAWRVALRDTLAPLLGDGWRVTGFDPATGYLVERP